MRNGIVVAAMGIMMTLGLVGCSNTAAPGNSVKYNGELLSETKVTGTPVQAAATLYRIYYWCAGQRLEAYTTIPIKTGKVPLLVYLHGGSAWNGPSHSSFGYTAALAGRLASSTYVVMFPEYQGYMSSTGSVQGLYTDTQDTVCGIHAVESTGRIDSHALYLSGRSIGGGVALKVASELAHVRAVVAISPYVGLGIVEPWQETNAGSGTIFAYQLGQEIASYGRHPSRQTLARQSIDIAGITAPVLLLQGTGDQHVAWQTVQTFDQEMQAAGKTVKLILYPGGHHGLKGPQYALISHDAEFTWLLGHGLPRAY
jgi:dipeptidyl aminopeptidase/acylaminoacyl peptidase